MRKEIINFLNKELYYIGNNNPTILIIYIEENEDLNKTEEKYNLLNNNDIALLSFNVDNWNNDLSPWFNLAVFNNEDFNGNGDKTLLSVKELMNKLKEEYKNTKFIIGGYSLAGLFVLYMAYNLDCFDGVVAASPSVWFDKWDEYILNNRIKTNNIYLSLGNKEKNSKNERMSKVEERIILQRDVLLKDNKNVYLEFNPGGHFKDPIDRLIKGFKYLIEICK